MKRNHLLIINLLVLTILFSHSTLAQSLQTAELYLETGHTSDITAIAFSPDKKILASASGNPSGSDDNTIKLWDLALGKELKTFTGYDKPVDHIIFSADGKLLVSVSSGNTTIKFWGVTTGKEIRILEGDLRYFKSVAFSSDGIMFAAGGYDNTVKVWDLRTGREYKTFVGQNNETGGYVNSTVNSLVFSPDNKMILAGSADGRITVWDIDSEIPISSIEHDSSFQRSVFQSDGKTIASIDINGTINLWDISSKTRLLNLADQYYEQQTKLGWGTSARELISISPDGNMIVTHDENNHIILLDSLTGKNIEVIPGNNERITSLAFSPDGKILAYGGIDKTIRLWDIASRRELKTLQGNALSADSALFSPDGEVIAVENDNQTIKLWFKNSPDIKTLKGHTSEIMQVVFSSDSKMLASGSLDNSIRIWDIKSAKELKIINTAKSVNSIGFSTDGKKLVSGSDDGVLLWDLTSDKEPKQLIGHKSLVFAVGFSEDDTKIASVDADFTVILWNAISGEPIKTFQKGNPMVVPEVFESVPNVVRELDKEQEPKSSNGKFQIKRSQNGKLDIFYIPDGKLLLSLISFNESDWVVTTPYGHFDTNKSLDNIEGLHWIVNDEILKPLPLDIFMRKLYQPNLLQRLLNCYKEDNCDMKFEPDTISDQNRVQPKVVIKEINLVKNADGLADVTVEVESVTEDVSISATDRDKKEKKTSKAFDLRLFRDGQLVGVSTPKDKLESFIKAAPELIEQNKEYIKKTGKLTNTPEDVAWREANDIFALVDRANVKRISDNKLEYTFRKVRLPKGRENVEFTAYAFNEDKVKSTTTEPFKYTIPKTIANLPKKGKAVVISIGVNASQNPEWDLLYAANDARKMQEIVGKKLEDDAGKYSEIIKIPLISDHQTDKYPKVNTAQKKIIKGVFSLMSGVNYDEVLAEIKKGDSKLVKEFESIENIKKLKQIEPEDTLIISFSGHGYADRSGIFYLLPYDIGEKTEILTNEVLNKLISSDELSLWMQDITAEEMIFVIDACYSSSAVGTDFKPGPMGSRGLGQLAYDKDMKILSATQANNVALELSSLKQGLLSYALLEDGINEKLADSAPKDKKISTNEWLSFAEKRVPDLYKEVKSGKRPIIINGKNVTGEKARSDLINLDGEQKSNLNLQQPSLFDFKRRKSDKTLFLLP